MTEKFCIAIQLPLRFVPKGPIDNVSIDSDNGWAPNRWQAIPEPMLTQVADAYVRL